MTTLLIIYAAIEWKWGSRTRAKLAFGLAVVIAIVGAIWQYQIINSL